MAGDDSQGPLLCRVVGALREAAGSQSFDEFTVELNPEDVAQRGEAYAEALKNFVDDANAKLDDIEDELAKKEGKKRSHGRFASPAQAPVHKPSFGATGAVAPSYVAPAAAAAAPVTTAASTTVMPAPAATPAPTPGVEKDLSGFGDAAEAFDLGDID